MAIRKRGNIFQVTYRVPGEKSPRTESFKSEDEALIRDAQIRLAKKNGTFTAPVRLEKGVIETKKEITKRFWRSMSNSTASRSGVHPTSLPARV